MGTADKTELRAKLLAARVGLPPEWIAEARARVRAHVLARFDAARRIAAYRPMRTEPASLELLDTLATRAEVLVPLLRPDRDLDWTPWPSGRPLGVDAIADVDVVLAPALAVSRNGVRLGRGGGSYDRALARVPAGVPIVALLYDDELVDELPHDDWDIPVAGAITPSGWHDLRP
jgi:5-formyltetrahydrofolate cyclo-ligase